MWREQAFRLRSVLTLDAMRIALNAGAAGAFTFKPRENEHRGDYLLANETLPSGESLRVRVFVEDDLFLCDVSLSYEADALSNDAPAFERLLGTLENLLTSHAKATDLTRIPMFD